MTDPDDFRPEHEKQGSTRLAAVTGIAVGAAATALALLQLPFAATASAASGPYERAGSQVSASAAMPDPGATYQLRCWQSGRLLIDEGLVTLGAEARQAAKLVVSDRRGAPLIVTEIGGSTCVARLSGPARSLAPPR